MQPWGWCSLSVAVGLALLLVRMPGGGQGRAVCRHQSCKGYICPVGMAARGATGAAARCKVARSGLLLCRGHKGKCWVQRLGMGPGRGFQLAQRFAGCDDWAATQTLMSWQFLCAPAWGSALARL